MSKMNLMILAAGYGKRMKSLTNNKPKPLLSISNKELLGHTIDFFFDIGCNKIVINTHYLHDQINNFINRNYYKKNIKLIFEPQLLNTGGGIKNALNILGTENFLVTNSDIFWTNINRSDVITFIKKYEEIQTCKLLISENKKFKGLKKIIGDFKLEDKLIKRWVKNDPILYYSGLQIINPNIFSLFKKKCFSMNTVWDKLIYQKSLEGVVMNSNIIHIGDFKSFNKIKNH